MQEFCKVILKHKAASSKNADEGDTIDAFIALGGNPDKTGQISTEKLRATIKVRWPSVTILGHDRPQQMSTVGPLQAAEPGLPARRLHFRHQGML